MGERSSMSDADLESKLQPRLAEVESRIRAACERARRSRDEVTLVAVTKTVSSEVAACLANLGVRDLGENRPQELWRKAESVANVRWHMIGHLQRNKIERTLPLVTLTHSVDSLRLLRAIDEFGKTKSQRFPVLLEMNASGESSKGGFAPTDVPELSAVLPALQFVEVRGLMTMAAFQEPEACRPTFALLRSLLESFRSAGIATMRELSMGMSNDFEIAIEEGATLIRLGTVLFEGIES